MSQLLNILLTPYNFFFGENGIFSSFSGQRRASSQGLYFGIPAVVCAILGLLFLIVGELSAGKSLVQKYKNNVEEISQEEAELKSKLSQKLKLAKATQSDPYASGSEVPIYRNELSQKLEAEQILLSKLYSLAPEEPKHLFDLALTYLTKSNLTMLRQAATVEEKRTRLSDSIAQKNQCMAIMKQIAPLTKPGLLEAHIFLAKDALTKNRNVKSSSDEIMNLRLANVHLDHALLRDEKNTTALGLKVLILQQVGNLKEAKPYLTEIFASDPFVYPQLCSLNNRLGVASENDGVINSAQQRLSEVIDRMSMTSSDRRTKYVTYLVDCYHRLGKLKQADDQVEKEMAEFPDNAVVQRWGKRLLSLSQVLRYEAGTPRVKDANKLKAAWNKLSEDELAELIEYLREGYRLDPNNVRLLKHIVQLPSSGVPGLEKVSKEIYQPGAKAPASVENILGTLALEKNDYLEATMRFTRANKKDPTNAEYLNNLSFVYLTRPDPDPAEALKMIDKAIGNVRAGTITTSYLTNFLDTKGRALLALGKIAEKNGDQELADSRYAAAAAKLLGALVDRPDHIEISQAVIECYEALGQTQQVEVWRERVKELQSKQTP